MHASVFICPPIHLSLISFTLLSLLPLNETMHTVHNKPLGLHSIVRRVHTTPFPVVEPLLACCDKRQPFTTTHTHTIQTCSFITTGSLGFISQTAGMCWHNVTVNQHIVHAGVTSQDNTLKNQVGWVFIYLFIDMAKLMDGLIEREAKTNNKNRTDLTCTLPSDLLHFLTFSTMIRQSALENGGGVWQGSGKRRTTVK